MTRDLVVALSGGVGGAKLALGLSRVVPPGRLMVVANTGDDFEHLGLAVSPDLDTLLYTLAGARQSGDRLGPARRDLELHGGARGAWAARPGFASATAISRPMSSARGASRRARPCPRSPTDFRRRLGIAARIVPMSDDQVRTPRARRPRAGSISRIISCACSCEPAIAAIAFAGAVAARPQPDFLAALGDPSLRAVVICPVQPVHQHRADPGAAGRAPGACLPAPRRWWRCRRSSPAARSRARPRR